MKKALKKETKKDEGKIAKIKDQVQDAKSDKNGLLDKIEEQLKAAKNLKEAKLRTID